MNVFSSLFSPRVAVIPLQAVDNQMKDVEAGPNFHLDRGKYFLRKSSSHFLSLVLISIVFVIVTVFAMFVPMFIQLNGIRAVSNSGTFGYFLRTSTRLKIMESISIGCTLPMLCDNFLDKVTDKKSKMTLSMWHRILFLVAFSISSILYLNLSDYYFMPYLYIVLNNTKILLVGAVTYYSVLNGTIMNSLRSKMIFLFPVVFVGLRYVFEAYGLVYPEYKFLSTITSILFYLMFFSFFGVLIPWCYLLWCRYHVNKSLNNEEKKECVYMLAMLFFVITCQVVNTVFGYTDSWLDTKEEVLIGYIVVQIICILLATVLPTWFMRKVVQVLPYVMPSLNTSKHHPFPVWAR